MWTWYFHCWRIWCHETNRMNPADFSDTLTFPVAPPWSSHCVCAVLHPPLSAGVTGVSGFTEREETTVRSASCCFHVTFTTRDLHGGSHTAGEWTEDETTLTHSDTRLQQGLIVITLLQYSSHSPPSIPVKMEGGVLAFHFPQHVNVCTR